MLSFKWFRVSPILSLLISSCVYAQTTPTQKQSGSSEFSAFIDVEGRFANRRTFLDRGITLNDASLVWTKPLSKHGRVFIDLPFSSKLDGETNELDFADHRAEAHLLFERSPFQLKFGQYATFLGYEASSSRARFFADWGPIRSYVLPKTHTGAQLEFGDPALSVLLQLANPNGASAPGTESVEVGAGAKAQVADLNFLLGGTFSESQISYPGNRTNILVEFRAGFGRDRFRLDGSIDLKKSAGSDKTGNAFGILGTFNIDETWAVGGRIEKLTDIYTVLVTGAGTFDSVFAASVGGHYRLQPDLLIRGDLTTIDMKAPGIDEAFHVVTISTVAEF